MSIVGAPLFVATIIATVAGGVAALLAPLARGRAALRHLLWQGALVVAAASALTATMPMHPRIVLPVLRGSASPQASRGARSSAHPDTSAPPRHGDARIVLVVWLVGCSYVALRHARSLSRAAALRRGASCVDAARWNHHLVAARAAIGYRGPVDVLVSREIDVPVVVGLRRPAILLPVAASEWSEIDTRLVFLHELAHVERGDQHGRALGMLALVLHWFNPVVWWLNARASADAELAADETVLSTGVRSTDYADMLISIAERTVWRPALVPGVALVRRPLLAVRVHAILAASRRRAAIGPWQRRMTVASAACVAATLGSARVQLVAAREPTSGASATSAAVPRTIRETARMVPSPSSRSPVEKNHPALTARAHSPRASRPSEPDDAWTARAMAGLREALDDPSPQVRDAAARSLSRLAGAGG